MRELAGGTYRQYDSGTMLTFHRAPMSSLFRHAGLVQAHFREYVAALRLPDVRQQVIAGRRHISNTISVRPPNLWMSGCFAEQRQAIRPGGTYDRTMEIVGD